MKRVDINCDLGEGIGNDEAVMPYISSANIACGYHAGDLSTMDRTLQMAIKNNVSVGAHPGFNDRDNFGRVHQKLSNVEIEQLVREQIEILQDRATRAGAQLSHVKPHGALYNMAAADETIALAIARGIRSVNPALLYYGLANSPMIKAANEVGLIAISEVFADRAYTRDGCLVPRNQEGAVIHDAQLCQQRVLDMVLNQRVKSIDGQTISIQADTICIHGDNPEAVALAKGIYTTLINNDIELVSPLSAAL